MEDVSAPGFWELAVANLRPPSAFGRGMGAPRSPRDDNRRHRGGGRGFRSPIAAICYLELARITSTAPWWVRPSSHLFRSRYPQQESPLAPIPQPREKDQTAGRHWISAPVPSRMSLCLAALAGIGDASGTRQPILCRASAACERQLPPAQDCDGNQSPIASWPGASFSSQRRRSFTHSVSPNSRPDRRLGQNTKSAIGPRSDRDAIRHASAGTDDQHSDRPCRLNTNLNLSIATRAICRVFAPFKPIKTRSRNRAYKITLPAQYGSTVPACPIAAHRQVA